MTALLLQTPRHPELVSGSIPRFARNHRRQAQRDRQIPPLRVLGIDEVEFPLPMPALQLLLAQDGAFHVGKKLEMNETVNGVSRREAGQGIVPVLPESTDKVLSHADIERALVPAREDVDARLAFVSHGAGCAAQWMLKQVQHDGIAKISPTMPAEYHRHPELVSGSISRQAPNR